MTGYVNGIDWVNCEAMKYWSFPKTYKKDSKAETKNLIFGGRYWGALKRDGYYQRFVKDEDGNMFMIAQRHFGKPTIRRQSVLFRGKTVDMTSMRRMNIDRYRILRDMIYLPHF